MQGPKSDQMNDSIWQSISEKDDYLARSDTSAIPGGFPQDDLIENYMAQDHSEVRPAKRLHRDKSEFNKEWVMVSASAGSRESSPSRAVIRKIPRASSPVKRPGSSETAGLLRAGKRPTLHPSRPSLSSQAGLASQKASTGASYASPRSPSARPSPNTPLSAEAQRFAKKIKKRETQDDASMKRLNAQLKAMIREGKEALGTKIEIEDEMEDEGYGEGDIF